ncbi:Uncharacterized protein SCF082_LOCUS7237 [Durusdinium trenchii]|uniref:DUF7869 domain-containing protein n=1 Tax=Durusdinium trenchii TaxID=1381693 RepID=A0ABP0IHX0_9DINO
MGDSSEVELPPDVSSDDPGSLKEESEVELPPDVLDDEVVGAGDASHNQHCTCRLQCFTKFAQESVELHRNQQLGDSNSMAKTFHKIKQLVDQRPDGEANARIGWAIGEVKVCRPFWEHYYAVGHKQVDDMVKLSKAGHAQLPERGARMPREKLKMDEVDMWFLNLYQGSEPTPMEDPPAGRLEELGDDDSLQHEVVNSVHHPLYSLSVAVGDGVNKQHLVPKRYLNETNVSSLWNLYQSDEKVPSKVSRDTFNKAFKKHWRSILQFKGYGQGTRCQLCADLDEERKHCTSKEERASIDIRKRRHYERTDADRSMNVRSNQLSCFPATFQLSNAGSRVVKFMVDGMDQAKFRTPRNLAASSAFAQCHRHAILAADNTPREAKNQIFATFAGSLVQRKLFDTIEVQFMQAGHTKNELDQRFSTLATVLSKAPVLETPEEFAQCIRKNVQPLHGKELHVIVLENTWDFQAMFEKYQCQISGLTSTHLQPNANHLPQLMLPHDLAEKMDFRAELKPAERRWLSEEVQKEFRKTSRIVGTEPWRLFEAQNWLQVLCDENEQKINRRPPQLDFVLEMGTTGDVGILPDYSDLYIPDDPDPREVRVGRGAKGMKRPAAAPSGPPVLKRPAAMRRPAAARQDDAGGGHAVEEPEAGPGSVEESPGAAFPAEDEQAEPPATSQLLLLLSIVVL